MVLLQRRRGLVEEQPVSLLRAREIATRCCSPGQDAKQRALAAADGPFSSTDSCGFRLNHGREQWRPVGKLRTSFNSMLSPTVVV
jgi:hypothetical protein